MGALAEAGQEAVEPGPELLLQHRLHERRLGPHEKEHARNHLARHVQAGRLAPEQAASYVMAKGVSDRGGKRLRLLLEKAG
ncbi:hypothetical protein FNH13_16990 [Ornithinimicrobium ciconiae]|uniref:Uncharacterized protein n=1 Tax=Ornithinimicrobium ciconiae TaxID=2594265 RepID=A0A516GEQ8_9MICO|nr:hypothetical protein FNH13_16990 [Ornithinimicrobium ciconiae]